MMATRLPLTSLAASFCRFGGTADDWRQFRASMLALSQTPDVRGYGVLRADEPNCRDRRPVTLAVPDGSRKAARG